MTDLVPPSRAFVLGLANEEGALDANVLYKLAAAVGLTDTTIRLTLRRLVQSELAESSGRGRSAQIQLTAAGLAERAPDVGWTVLAYRLDQGLYDWDQRWHLVSFEIPEAQRTARDALRNQLHNLLGASHNGLYVSTHEWEPWVSAIAAHHGIERHVTMISTDHIDIGGETDPSEIASQLWPLNELNKQAKEFIDRWSNAAVDPPADLRDAARAAYLASTEFEALLRQDPLIPRQLEPNTWNPPAARQLYRTLIDQLSNTHDEIRQANVFAAFSGALDRTATMSQTAFDTWLWNATHPRE
ncbi:MAG: PaaX family transcriptional regulator C-terminal domain-containing protein [Acidimicrobiales bacterium]